MRINVTIVIDLVIGQVSVEDLLQEDLENPDQDRLNLMIEEIEIMIEGIMIDQLGMIEEIGIMIDL